MGNDGIDSLIDVLCIKFDEPGFDVFYGPQGERRIYWLPAYIYNLRECQRAGETFEISR